MRNERAAGLRPIIRNRMPPDLGRGELRVHVSGEKIWPMPSILLIILQ